MFSMRRWVSDYRQEFQGVLLATIHSSYTTMRRLALTMFAILLLKKRVLIFI